jgi:selenocysteine lyase/cysteine desulfurase
MMMNNIETSLAFSELKTCIETVLKTYSNVHRGSGHFSSATTFLFEHAREKVLEFLSLDKSEYVVIFCSPAASSAITPLLKEGSFRVLSSVETGLPLGIRAIAVKRTAIPAGAPPLSGGGTTRLISPDWVVWAGSPERFEAGTPSVINIIAFVKSLQLMRKYGNGIFKNTPEASSGISNILNENEPRGKDGRELLDELRKTLIGHDTIVPTCEGERRYINLDNAASTSTFTAVWESVFQTWQQSGGTQEKVIDEVRKICSGFIEAPLEKYDIIFTQNTTESINVVAENLTMGSSNENGPVIINSIMEHNSNDLPWRSVPGSSVIRLGIDDEGFIDLAMLEKVLREYNKDGLHGDKRISIVAICGASNVLGTYNDLGKITAIVHSYDAEILVDAAQLVAHSPVLMDSWGIDYLVFSAHKAYAPFGAGVLVARKGLLNFDAEKMQLIKSSGEENTGGIAGLGKALILLRRVGIDIIMEEERKLTQSLLTSLNNIKGVTVYGISDPGTTEKGGIVVFILKGRMANQLAREISDYGIGVRYGCHCAHILIKHMLHLPVALQRFQRVLAILFSGMKFPGLLRVSIGLGNTSGDIDEFIRVLSVLASRTPRGPEKELKNKIEKFISETDLIVFS